jgi:membrane-associated phospholipid phosphatase
MKNRLPASLAVLVCLACPSVGLAQTLTLPSIPLGQPVGPTSVAAPAPVVPSFTAPKADGFWAPFTSVPKDFVNFISMDTARIIGITGGAALVASKWDSQALDEAQERFPASKFKAGNVAGQFLVQMGASFGVYTFARLTGNERLSEVGGDLLRAQMLSQGIVQAGKMMTNRQRPDGSNSHSLPSGHTASAFATATVLQDHFGWKVGVPAYAFGTYVAAARMSANKHNLSDVLMGAAIGVASAHTVTLGSGRAKFGMGIAPTVGGAAVMFTKKTSQDAR